MNFGEIKEIMNDFSKLSLTSLEIVEGTFEIRLSKDTICQMPVKGAVQSSSIETAPPKNEGENIESINNFKNITAPIVGIFYTSPSPSENPFVKEGDRVEKGDVIGIVEAMKMINEIKSPFSGVIRNIKVQNEQLLEFGQVIMEIEE